MLLSRLFGPSLSRDVGSLADTLRSFSSTCLLPGSAPYKVWRLPEQPPAACWPNYKEHLTHHSHKRQHPWHTYGIQKQTCMRVVDNSTLGREAMAEGRPPRVIQVYSKKHKGKPHGCYGKLGDRVMVAVLGQKKKGIIVGLKVKQRHGIPRYDTNNIVLIEENGNPTGNRILSPLPNCIRPELKEASDPKKADYTKLFAIASKWV